MMKDICFAILMTLFAFACLVGIVSLIGAGGCAPVPNSTAPAPHVTPTPAPPPNPIFHPVAAAQPTVHAIQHPLIIATVLATMLAGAFFGLEFFAPLSLVGKIGFPITAGVAASSMLGAFSAPFVPYMLYGSGVLLVAFGVYEFFHLRIKQRVETKIETSLPPVPPLTSTGV